MRQGSDLLEGRGDGHGRGYPNIIWLQCWADGWQRSVQSCGRWQGLTPLRLRRAEAAFFDKPTFWRVPELTLDGLPCEAGVPACTGAAPAASNPQKDNTATAATTSATLTGHGRFARHPLVDPKP